MTARQIIEARMGRPLPPAAQMRPDERRAREAKKEKEKQDG